MQYSGGFTPETSDISEDATSDIFEDATSDISEDASSDATEAKMGELSMNDLRSASESEEPRQTSPGNILQQGSRIMNMRIRGPPRLMV